MSWTSPAEFGRLEDEVLLHPVPVAPNAGHLQMRHATPTMIDHLPLPLTPESLLPLLKIAAPDGPVLVKGVVSQAKRYTGKGTERIYGRLALGGASIRFCIDIACAVADGDCVLIHGTLNVRSIEPDRLGRQDWRTTHEVMLYGTIAGRWTAPTPATPVTLPTLARTTPRLSLHGFIEQHGLDRLRVLATDTAIADVRQAFGGQVAELRFADLPFHGASAFIAALEQVDWTDVAGFAVARGGGGGLESLANSPFVVEALLKVGLPFYAALGHTDDVSLVDKYADATFATPSLLGTELASIRLSLINRAVQEESAAQGIAQLRADSKRKDTEIVWLKSLLRQSEPASNIQSTKLPAARETPRQGRRSRRWVVAIGILAIFALAMLLK